MRKSIVWILTSGALGTAAPSFAANGAAFVAQTVPATVQTGESFSVDVTMQNTGDTAWTPGSGHYLGSQNPQDNTTWGTNRIAMAPSDSVNPGQSYVFHANLTAPAQPGDYDFQWQMLQDAVAWFGEPSPNAVVQVQAQAPLSCDGTEKLCLTLTDLAAIQASGATIAGDVSSDGFVPSDQGGLDWHFVPSDGLCSGRMEVDVQGLLPQMSSSDPEQISVFETCGEGAEGIQVVGLQRMMLNYHGNNIFRYYATTDFDVYGWELGVWTDGFEATNWTADQTHHFVASWSADEGGNASLTLSIDGQSWNAAGTWPFNPQSQIFTLANRCTHYPGQHAAARFSNFRLWAYGGCESPTAQDGGAEAGPDSAAAADGEAPEAGDEGGEWPSTGGSGGAAGTGGGDADGGFADAGWGSAGADAGGCGCRTTPSGVPAQPAVELLLALGLVTRRRKKR